MKKVISAFVACFFALSAVSVMAQEICDIKTTETEIEVITYLGEEFAGSEVGLEIIKPKKERDDLDKSSSPYEIKSILAYADQTSADFNGTASFIFTLKEDDVGYYTAVISCKGRKIITKKFPYAPEAAIVSLIKSIEEENADASDAEKLFELTDDEELAGFEILGFSDLDAYKDVFMNDLYGTEEKKLRVFSELIAAVKNKNYNKEQFAEAFEDAVYRSVVFTLSNSSVMLDYIEKYSEQTGLSNSRLYESVYQNSRYFSDKEKNTVAREIVNYKWESCSKKDISDTLDEIIFMTAVKAVSDGYGKIGELLELAKEVLTERGADFADYETSNMETVWRSISSKETMDAFVKALNKSIKENQKSKASNNSYQRSPGIDGGKKSSVALSGSETTTALTENIAQNVFSDIDNVTWAREAILELHKKGAIDGKEAGRFCPDDDMKRSEFLKVLMKSLGISYSGTETYFSDVPADSWYYSYVSGAYSIGIVNGYGDTFAPDNAISREEAAVMISRCMGIVDKELPELRGDADFEDFNSVSEYAKESISSLYKAKIIDGMSGNYFAPKDNITRAQAVKLIYGLLKTVSQEV